MDEAVPERGGTVVARTLEPGGVFAGYRIKRVLGAGGMGTVYLARDPRLPRDVALKVLHNAFTLDPSVRARFDLEAEHAARLDHPCIVTVFDRGRVDDHLWIAMRFIPGDDAGAVLAREGVLSPQRVLRVAAEVARALDYAHSNGVLHRDVKPANIILAPPTMPDEPERVMLADFGISKTLGDTAATLTKTGTTIATLLYASPEQLDGADLDGRTDVYSLGCTVFHLLTGTPPYPGPNPSVVIRGHLTGPIPAASGLRPELGQEADAVFETALAHRRENRYATASAFADALARALRTVTLPSPTPDPSSAAGTGLSRSLSGRGVAVVGAAAAVVLIVIAAAILALTRNGGGLSAEARSLLSALPSGYDGLCAESDPQGAGIVAALECHGGQTNPPGYFYLLDSVSALNTMFGTTVAAREVTPCPNGSSPSTWSFAARFSNVHQRELVLTGSGLVSL